MLERSEVLESVQESIVVNMTSSPATHQRRSARAWSPSSSWTSLPSIDGAALRYQQNERFLTAAWGGRSWFPPERFLRGAAKNTDYTRISTGHIVYLKSITKLAQASGIDLSGLYEPGGALYEAMLANSRTGLPVWSSGTSRAALDLLKAKLRNDNAYDVDPDNVVHSNMDNEEVSDVVMPDTPLVEATASPVLQVGPPSPTEESVMENKVSSIGRGGSHEQPPSGNVVAPAAAEPAEPPADEPTDHHSVRTEASPRKSPQDSPASEPVLLTSVAAMSEARSSDSFPPTEPREDTQTSMCPCPAHTSKSPTQEDALCYLTALSAYFSQAEQRPEFWHQQLSDCEAKDTQIHTDIDAAELDVDAAHAAHAKAASKLQSCTERHDATNTVLDAARDALEALLAKHQPGGYRDGQSTGAAAEDFHMKTPAQAIGVLLTRQAMIRMETGNMLETVRAECETSVAGLAKARQRRSELWAELRELETTRIRVENAVKIQRACVVTLRIAAGLDG
jgi:hypothetical protein